MHQMYSILPYLPVRAARSARSRQVLQNTRESIISSRHNRRRHFGVCGRRNDEHSPPSVHAEILQRTDTSSQSSGGKADASSDGAKKLIRDHQRKVYAADNILATLDSAIQSNDPNPTRTLKESADDLDKESSSSDAESQERSRSSHERSYLASRYTSTTTVIVTGASGAIGFAIAQAFARQGHSIVLCGRNRAKLTANLQKLEAEGTVPRGTTHHEMLIGDVCDEEFVTTHLPELFKSRLSNLKLPLSRSSRNPKAALSLLPTVLVNCAGVTQYNALLSMGETQRQDIMQTNLMAAIRVTGYFTKQVLKSRIYYRDWEDYHFASPCIINVSSLLATHGGRGATIYAASKAGMLGFGRALAAELSQKNVRVNTILPGYVKSDMTDLFSPKAKELLVRDIPMGRFGRPDEIAHAAVFLAENEYCNNCELRVDGGLSAVIGIRTTLSA